MFLVIAYGNPQRGDDGAAWRVAEGLCQQSRGPMKLLCAHQLTPELAEDVSAASTVVFVDSCQANVPGAISCTAVAPRSKELRFSHALSPSGLLRVCEEVYGTVPEAFLLTIGATDFDHGTTVSPPVLKGISEAVARITELADCAIRGRSVGYQAEAQ